MRKLAAIRVRCVSCVSKFGACKPLCNTTLCVQSCVSAGSRPCVCVITCVTTYKMRAHLNAWQPQLVQVCSVHLEVQHKVSVKVPGRACVSAADNGQLSRWTHKRAPRTCVISRKVLSCGHLSSIRHLLGQWQTATRRFKNFPDILQTTKYFLPYTHRTLKTRP